MNPVATELLLVTASNILFATLVGVAAWFSLRRGCPRLAHGLSVLALLKLLTPPLVRFPVAEVGTSPPPLDLDTAALLLATADVLAPAAAAPDPAPVLDVWQLLLAVAATGSFVMASLVLARARRFHRIVRLARPASAGLVGRARSIAETMRIGRCPELLVVPARISPMLCLVGWRARILLPELLLRQAPPAQVDALLAHELAHAARRDHWVRFLEVTAVCVTWWLPTTWWLRRVLRAAEERCCDADVLTALPRQARTYADALLSTLDFLADAPRELPPVACGSAFHDMKTRLTTIMSPSRSNPVPAPARAVLLACAAAVLPLAPTTAQEEPQEAQSRMRADLRAAQQEVEALRRELRELRATMNTDDRAGEVSERERAVVEADKAAEKAARLRARAQAGQHGEGGADHWHEHVAQIHEHLQETVMKRVEEALAKAQEAGGAFDKAELRRQLADVGKTVGTTVRDLVAQAHGHVDQEAMRRDIEAATKYAQEIARKAQAGTEVARQHLAEHLVRAAEHLQHEGQHAKAKALLDRARDHDHDDVAKDRAAAERAAQERASEAEVILQRHLEGLRAHGNPGTERRVQTQDELRELRRAVREMQQRIEEMTRRLERAGSDAGTTGRSLR